MNITRENLEEVLSELRILVMQHADGINAAWLKHGDLKLDISMKASFKVGESGGMEPTVEMSYVAERVKAKRKVSLGQMKLFKDKFEASIDHGDTPQPRDEKGKFLPKDKAA